jgi:nucleotide-binding universal stress UspA family protein
MSAILVPVDGSVHALKALRIAGDLAENYGGRIVLLHILVPDRKARRILSLPIADTLPTAVTSALEKASDRSRVPEAALRAVGERILEDADARVRRRGIETEIMPVEQGDPVQSILIAARHAGANTIVMGCRGLSDDREQGFGSVSRQVFQNAECTCISVK